jgi:hypothetical protein
MKIRLRVQPPNEPAYDFEHAGPSVSLGRNPEVALVFEQDSAQSVVSWDHARIDLGPREATLTDLRSTNGTYRNNQPVAGTVPLWPKDSIRLGASGPVLTVVEIDLSATAPPVRPAKAAAVAAVSAPAAPPVPARPAAKVKPARAPAPAISETRGILLEAIRQQQSAHSNQRRALATVAAVALALLLLLFGGLWLFGDRLRGVAARTEEVAETTQKGFENVDEQFKQINARVDQVTSEFARIDKDLEDRKQAEAENADKLAQIARDVARQEQAERQRQGKLDKVADNLAELNQKLAKPENRAGGGATGGKADAARAEAPPAAARQVALKPGQRMDVILKKGVFYTGSLVSIDKERVKLQTNPNHTKPSEFDIRDVQAFQTRDGVFAYDEATGTFESALTYYRLNRSSGEFERAESTQDAYLSEDASVAGPTSAAHALLSRGPAGELCVGLPLPASRSPGALPAYHFKEIVTSKGVYTYNESKHDYDFKAHAEIAAAIKAATDKFWKEREEKEHQRRVESYKLGTERVRALAGLYWRRWWWW